MIRIKTHLLVVFFIVFFIVNGCTQNDQFISDIPDFNGGDYIQLVYIGSSTCPYCNKSLHHEIKKLRVVLKEWANNHNYHFISTGVSADLYSRNAIRFLQESGPYDEIIAGGSWYNLGIQHYIWNEKNGEAYTPQIKVLRLKFEAAFSPRGTTVKMVREQELLLSMFRLNDIQNFNKSFNPTDSELVNYTDINSIE